MKKTGPGIHRKAIFSMRYDGEASLREAGEAKMVVGNKALWESEPVRERANRR